MQHKHVINLMKRGWMMYDKQDGTEPQEVLCIIMELAPNGELYDMVANTGRFSEPVARYFFRQLLDVVSFMHNEKKVCHRDIKLENILIDENFDLRLADFGFAASIVGPAMNGKHTDILGSKGFMCPELLAGIGYSGKAADMFALAVVLLMMVSRNNPFENAFTSDEKYRLIAGNRPSEFWAFYDKHAPISNDLKDLLTGMLQLDPSARSTLDEICSHPWMQGRTSTYQEIKKEFNVRNKVNDRVKKNAK